jgi:hypothetical protein
VTGRKRRVFRPVLRAESPDLEVRFAEGYRPRGPPRSEACRRIYSRINVKRWSGDHIVDPALVPACCS